MNTGTKIISKILANQIYQYIERILHCDQVGLIAGVKINVINNRTKDKYHVIILIDAGKVFD